MDKNLWHIQTQLCLIGTHSSGKTATLLQFTTGKFTGKHEVTVGVDFGVKIIDIRHKYQNKKIKLLIWDTAGQDAFRSITTSYYRSTIAFIIFADATYENSLKDVRYWLNEAIIQGNQYALFYIAINKMDLSHRIKTRSIDSIFSQLKEPPFNVVKRVYKISAKTGYNVQEMFTEITSDVCILSSQYNLKSQTINGIKLGPLMKSENVSKEQYNNVAAESKALCCCWKVKDKMKYTYLDDFNTSLNSVNINNDIVIEKNKLPDFDGTMTATMYLPELTFS
eukprot:1270_1